MITKETAAKIWYCYREIQVAEKLLADLKEQIARGEYPTVPDAFGHRRCLSLGVPSGHDSSKLFDVPPPLAIAMIEAHIAGQRAELAAANETAKLEA